MGPEPDCMACGACCRNPDANQAEGFAGWVEVTPDDAVRRGRRTARLVVVYPDGTAHMRLDPTGRCMALRGRIGGRVSCTIYEMRPRPCRRLQAGSEECLRHRTAAGVA